jgi:gamma-glutamyltranspeptidase/glutathione hydrolase
MAFFLLGSVSSLSLQFYRVFENRSRSMLHTLTSRRGIVVAPHHLAAQAGLAILREGGNAVEAMVAAAAAIAVTYPQMNSIGGDGFWLIAKPGEEPVGIDACGAAAAGAKPELYLEAGYSSIPPRGPLAALTVAGTVSGWAKALEVAAPWGRPLPLSHILRDAIAYSEGGIPVTNSFCSLIEDKLAELENVPGFKPLFLIGGLPRPGSILKNPALGGLLRHLSAAGLMDFYHGDAARSMAADLAAAGSPLRLSDLEAHNARIVEPLRVRLGCGDVYNLPPPTQGLASLLILALYDRLAAKEADGFDHVHRLAEATKAAFRIRDEAAVDPRNTAAPARTYLDDGFIDNLAAQINLSKARPWPEQGDGAGDTIWMGAIDEEGRAVSFIQSTYWEFGSGIVLPRTGVNWQNRGASFSLNPASPNALKPGYKPFHTLNPAMARLKDGRTMVYGTMGGDGQPQTQAAVFTRYVYHGYDLQAAISAPRWLLGRTWGDPSVTLKLEGRLAGRIGKALEQAGHLVEPVEDFSSVMGHAGAAVLHPDGVKSGAADPRSDGSAAAY